MSNRKILNCFFIVIGVSICFSFFIQDMRSRKYMLKSGSAPPAPIPQPYYGLLPVPETSVRAGSPGALGADFSQVYFSAKAIRSGESAYRPQSSEFKDLFGRRHGYPPLTNWLYIPLTSLPYYLALLVHTYGTMLLFFIITAVIIFEFGLLKEIWKIYTIYILLYFYTPIGFAHFERGQFDFFVASSFLLIFACIFLEKRGILYSIGAGFFGAIKWTSLPFLGTFGIFTFAGINSRRRWLFVLPLATVLLSGLIFLPQILDYLPSLRIYAFDVEEPYGVSFLLIMPNIMAKSVQIVCVMVMAVIFSRFARGQNRRDLFNSFCFPLALALALQGMSYGLFSFEYRIVSILGFIPCLMIWIEKANIPQKAKITVTALLAGFLVISFRVFDPVFRAKMELQSVLMTTFYLSCSIFLLGVCIYIMNRVCCPQKAGASH